MRTHGCTYMWLWLIFCIALCVTGRVVHGESQNSASQFQSLGCEYVDPKTNKYYNLTALQSVDG